MSPVNYPMMNMPSSDMPYWNDGSLTCYGITVAQEYEKEYIETTIPLKIIDMLK